VNKNFIRLFHATNQFSAQKMLQSGMGLNLVDYEKILVEIAARYGISDQTREKVWAHWTRGEDLKRGEYQGGVSFWPTFEQATRFAEGYAQSAGEWKGPLIKMLIKAHARALGVSFRSPAIQALYAEVDRDFAGGSSPAVVVEVWLPRGLVANKDRLDEGCEIYTDSKVPAQYIKQIHLV
jgi:hypothetical protein